MSAIFGILKMHAFEKVVLVRKPCQGGLANHEKTCIRLFLAIYHGLASGGGQKMQQLDTYVC